MHKNADRVVTAAADAGLVIEVREFPEGTHTAEQAAEAIGIGVGQIVKSLVFAVGASPKQPEAAEVVVALVSGANQLDERKLAAAAGTAKAWRIDANAVREATGYPVGGIPPMGHRTKLRTFVDPDLLAFDVVWAAAGTPNHNFGAEPNGLAAAAGAITADLAKRANP